MAPLKWYQYEENDIVRWGSRTSEVGIVARRLRGGASTVVRSASGAEFGVSVVFPASAEDIKWFLLNNSIKGMPEHLDFRDPQAIVDSLTAEIESAEFKKDLILQYIRRKREQKNARRREQKKQATQRLEQKAVEMYDDVEEGDMVRVVGVRNARFNWRQVINKGGSTFSGIQYSRGKRGVWIQGSHMTTTGADKIREVIKAEEHGIDICS